MYRPANFKRTFYNNLRVYDHSPSPVKVPRSLYASTVQSSNQRSRTSIKLRDDVFLKSQVHFSDKYVKEAKYIRDYQKCMDERLSVPKKLAKSPKNKTKNVRCSFVNPIEVLKEREASGERVDLNNYKKYPL